MEFLTRTGKPLPKAIVESAKTVGDDLVSRREFLATASTFGATAAVAYGMLGMVAPKAAHAGAHKNGRRSSYSVRSACSERSAHL